MSNDGKGSEGEGVKDYSKILLDLSPFTDSIDRKQWVKESEELIRKIEARERKSVLADIRARLSAAMIRPDIGSVTMFEPFINESDLEKILSEIENG